MAAHNVLGHVGEQVAALYMEKNGWYVRDRDWRHDGTDIDLVCIDEDDTILVFVEVKTRSNEEFGRPEEAVDAAKRRNIVRAANAYKIMAQKENRAVRYDIISVVGPGIFGDDGLDYPIDLNDYEIRHIENAFSLMDVYEDAPELGRKWYYKNRYFGG